ncbi:DUF7916 family protein, partial [Siminovitchia fortis]
MFSQNPLQSFIEPRAHIILLPPPPTLPGITPAPLHQQIPYIHQQPPLLITTIPTTHQPPHQQTIPQIPLHPKIPPPDLHHLPHPPYHPLP